jgi:hypothetical protein
VYFIIDKVLKLDAIEVKFKDTIKKTDFYGLESFKKLYADKLDKCLLVSKYGGK